MPDSVDFRNDASQDTLEFLAAFTKSVIDYGVNTPELSADLDCMQRLWNGASEGDLLARQLHTNYWMSDQWLRCAGHKYGLGVRIRVLIDEGGGNEAEQIYNALDPSEEGKVVNATCHANLLPGGAYEGYHFDMKPEVTSVS